MVMRIQKRFGGRRANEFERLFVENIGGQKTIAEHYRMKGHRMYSRHAKKIGLTYATCYEYKYERNADGSIKDKTGVSVGRDYTTASQCHGPAVPVYARDSEEYDFEPLDECPPSGCLYCAAENDGEPRCGDDLLGQALAVKFSHLKLPVVQ